jgi:hypothetical protein
VPEALEHAEHDGADKGECDIRGDNAQSADERTDEGHWELSLLTSLTSLPANAEVSKPFRAEKVSAAVSPWLLHRAAASATWLKKCEFNALKSP